MERIPNAQSVTVGDELFARGGEMGALMRSLSWADTPLGPSEQWPQSLRTAVSICLHSRFPILIWWGPELVMLYNDPYRDVIGAKHPQAMGAPGRDIFPEIWDTIGPMLQNVTHEGQATWSADQLTLLNRNGYVEECYFTFSFSPIYGGGGHVDGVFTAVTETTDSVLGERRLRTLRDLAVASEAHMPAEANRVAAQVLAHNSADLPFTLIYSAASIDGDRTADAPDHATAHDMAPTLAAYSGFVDRVRAEALGDDAALRTALSQAIRSGEAEVVTLATAAPTPMALAGDQLERDVRTALLLPIKPAGGDLVTQVLVAGISPLRALDDEYRGFLNLVAGHLATAIATATAYEQERRRAEALAELDRAKTAFFSNVSHEFRTPLTLMLGPLADALAAADAMTPATHAQLEMAQRNGQRLLRLVNSLLDFSRIEAGRNQARYEPTDLSSYTAELASAFRSLIEQAGLRLVVDCPPLADLPESVYVDRAMWEKIVLNLLSNAFKFTFVGEIDVTLRRVGDGVELMVRDTGVGVPAAEVGRLFERFHRVEGTHARTFEGSGIGLALTQELVHLHGGTIRAESVEGQGTAFFVRLPLGAAHLPPELVQAPTAPRSTAITAAPYLQEAERWLPDGGWSDVKAEMQPADVTILEESIDAGVNGSAGARLNGAHAQTADATTQSARILIADDNADMRDYLSRLLSARYIVETATNGAQALAAIQRRPPDLVVSDVMMPKLGGVELLQALRSDPLLISLPIILLSARAGEEAVVEGLSAGADDYLVKPFSARELMSRVAARLEIAQARRQSLERTQQLEAIFATMTDGVVLYDEQGRLAQWNEALARLFEFDAMPDYAQMPVTTRPARLQARDVHRQPIAPERLPFMRAMRGEDLTNGNAEDLIVTTPSGREKQVNVSAAPLRDATGRTLGAVAIYRDVTERRRARDERERLLAQLQQSESRLRRLVDANLIGVIFADAHRILDANDAFLSLIGYTRADLASGGIPWRAMTPPDLIARDDAAIEEMLATGEFAPFEKVYIRKDGSTVPILLGGALLAPEPMECVCFALDLSDRKRLEDALAARARLLEAVIEAVPDSLAVYDTDLHILINNIRSRAEVVRVASAFTDTANTTLEQRLTHIQPYTVEGAPFPVNDTAQARALRGEIVASDNAVEFAVRQPDGSTNIYNTTAAPIRDADGAITGVVAVSHDVTQRRQLEARTHEVLDALVEMATMITAVTDEADEDADAATNTASPTPTLTGVVQRLTRLAQGALGGAYTSVVVVDRETRAMQPLAVAGLAPEDEANWWASVTQARLEDFMTPADAASLYAGQEVVVDSSAQPPIPGQDYWGIHNALVVPAPIEGRLVALTAEARNRPMFTPQERDLARATARLAALVIQRERLARERAEAQTQAQVMREATRRMDEFLGIASHELRTPLTSITANVQIAERQMKRIVTDATGKLDTAEAISAKLERYSGLMRGTARQLVRLDRLVGDLLDTSRIQAGKLEFRMEPCDLLAIARDAVQEQQVVWPDRAIALELPRRSELSINADANRIGQVITNYLTNALKYSAEDQPVTTRVTLRTGSVRVAVRDHGQGLTPQQQARLWERFYRVPGVEQKSGSGVGLGLGLHICKTIIERHGGEVGVESAPGQGSTFWFTLPLLQS